jgi:hypothetical protein
MATWRFGCGTAFFRGQDLTRGCAGWEGSAKGVIHISAGQRPGFISPKTPLALKARFIPRLSAPQPATRWQSQAIRWFELSRPNPLPVVPLDVNLAGQTNVLLRRLASSTPPRSSLPTTFTLAARPQAREGFRMAAA